MNKINSLLNLIKASLYKGDKPSSSRLFSYVMMSIIWLFGLIYAVVEIGNATMSWKHGNVYIPAVQNITIFGMLLAHQLTLLGIYKNAEVSFDNKSEIKNTKVNNSDELITS